MMVKLGNLIFHNRNGIFPLFYLVLFIPSPEIFADPVTAMAIGFSVTLLGQIIRIVTIGLVYIIRGGKDRRIYAGRSAVTTGYRSRSFPKQQARLLLLKIAIIFIVMMHGLRAVFVSLQKRNTIN